MVKHHTFNALRYGASEQDKNITLQQNNKLVVRQCKCIEVTYYFDQATNTQTELYAFGLRSINRNIQMRNIQNYDDLKYPTNICVI